MGIEVYAQCGYPESTARTVGANTCTNTTLTAKPSPSQVKYTFNTGDIFIIHICTNLSIGENLNQIFCPRNK